ncbi:hypothetical protein ACQCN2_12920 [Brevibacillus ginsengisoli]|uniref:hypothetical protein n=1 Tax=Brevibacillus ginsengisoli TaxID=363854 RepID=UPI003CF03DA0
MVAGSIQTLLQQFVERVNRKAFLRIVTKNWVRNIGVMVQDRNQAFALVFRGEVAEYTPWQEHVKYDVVIRGREQDIRLFFQGDELTYLHIRPSIETTGSIRDQLKMDTLIRLSARQVS